MAQFARPSSNVTQTEFTGGFAEIDEATASNTDLAWATDGADATLEVGLSSITDPAVGTGHVFRYRAAKTNDGVLDGAGNAKSVTVSLYQGAVLIASDVERTLTGSWQDFSLTLTGTQADAISNYADLRLRFVTLGGGGNPTNRRGIGIAWAELEAPNAPSLNHYTLTADQQSFSSSGQVASLLAGRVITGDVAAFTLSGQSTTLTTGRKIAAEQASFTLTGQNTTLTIGGGLNNYSITADEQSFSLTGNNTSLVVSRRLPADPASFTYTGQAAGLRATRKLTADQGAIAVSGSEVNISNLKVYSLTAEPGSVALTGNAVESRASRVLPAVSVTFTLTGQNTNLTVEAGLTHRTLEAGSGAIVMSGSEVEIATGKIILASSGTLTLTGSSVSFQKNYILAAEESSYSLSGRTVHFRIPGRKQTPVKCKIRFIRTFRDINHRR